MSFIIKALRSVPGSPRGYGAVLPLGLYFYDGPKTQRRATRFESRAAARAAIAGSWWCAPPADVRVVRLVHRKAKPSVWPDAAVWSDAQVHEYVRSGVLTEKQRDEIFAQRKATSPFPEGTLGLVAFVALNTKGPGADVAKIANDWWWNENRDDWERAAAAVVVEHERRKAASGAG